MSAEPWSVPVAVAEVPEIGRRVHLVADEPTRAAVAMIADVPSLPRLEAKFELTRHSRDGLRVMGNVSATVEQTCVVTLELMTSEVEEAVDLVFLPERMAKPGADNAADDEPPETLREGAVDLGAIATEFLILGIDPYPRKPGTVFEPPRGAEEGTSHPFAALAALKKDEPR